MSDPDLVVVVCAYCRSRFEAAVLPLESFGCVKCGATLAAVIVQVVHQVTTTVVRVPSEVSEFGDDPTPVADPIPLVAVGEER